VGEIVTQTSTMREAARRWESVWGAELSTIGVLVAAGIDQRAVFGTMMAAIGTAHDDFILQAARSLRVGQDQCEAFAAALRRAAEDYDRTDRSEAGRLDGHRRTL